MGLNVKKDSNGARRRNQTKVNNFPYEGRRDQD